MANVPKRDALGDRMKRYENTTRFQLPPRTYTILRVDGRAFHTWTKGLNKPYDGDFMECMDAAAITLCEQVAGAKFAFVQSDEISVLATDFADVSTEAWFDGVVQKWASVAASVATMAFNERVSYYNSARDTTTLGSRKRPTAVFDARVFTIPDYIEVENYFVWRQKDAAKNSVTLLASAYASPKQLHGKSISDRQEVIHNAGDNWAKHPVRFKHGAVIRPRNVEEFFTTAKQRAKMLDAGVPIPRQSNWVIDSGTPVFTKYREYLRKLIPRHWDNDKDV